MLVGYIKGHYIFKYETNSILGARYEISDKDGEVIEKIIFSNDPTAPLKFVETIANSDSFTIQKLLIG